MNEEEKYLADLKANGVDVPEEEAPVVTPEEKPEEDKEPEGDKPEGEEEDPEGDGDDKVEKRKSIYKEYKETKKELRSEKELRAETEAQLSVLQDRIKTLESAKTPEEKVEAKDELDEFAKEIGADPEVVKKMRDIILKDSKKSEIDPEVLKRLNEVDAHNKVLIKEKEYETNFSKVAPSVKELFPKLSDEELGSVKTELSKLADKPEWQGKDLDYILFKNKESLSKLVSPKKKGMESRGRADITIDSEPDFNPNADITQMLPKERESWEKTYRTLGKTDGLTQSGNKKIII